jgi:hypothetical protein
MIHWLKSLWSTGVRIGTMVKEVADLKGRVTQLGGEVDQLKAEIAGLRSAAPPKPVDLYPLHGIYWGRHTASARLQAYCPSCTVQGVYTPMKREDAWADGAPRRDGRMGYMCPRCKVYSELSLGQEREALQQ